MIALLLSLALSQEFTLHCQDDEETPITIRVEQVGRYCAAEAKLLLEDITYSGEIPTCYVFPTKVSFWGHSAGHGGAEFLGKVETWEDQWKGWVNFSLFSEDGEFYKRRHGVQCTRIAKKS